MCVAASTETKLTTYTENYENHEVKKRMSDLLLPHPPIAYYGGRLVPKRNVMCSAL